MNLLDLTVKITCDDSEAKRGIENISTWTIAKGVALGNAITGAFAKIGSAIVDAFKTAGSKIVDIGQQALTAYGKYEQLKGGIETLYKNGSDAVMKYAKDAYKTAGLSANQYMETATSFASSLIGSLAKRHQETVQIDLDAERKMLDNQLAQEKAAMEDAYKEQQRVYARQQTEFKRTQEDEYDAYKDNLDKELDALKESNDQRVEDTKRSQEQQVKDFEDATNQKLALMQEEYEESLRLVDEELYRQTKAIDSQIDALNAKTEAERQEQKRQEREQKKSDLQKAVSAAETAEEREKAELELSKYLAKIAQEDREADRKRQIDDLKQQKSDLKDQAASRKDVLKKQYQEEVELYKKARAEEKAEMEKANSEQLAAMKKSNDEKYRQQREENERLLKEFKRSQEDEMTNLKESHERQLADMKASQEAQYQALKDGAEARLKQLEEEANASKGFAEATEEDYIEAARITNMAITDMADNANKYGTAMESLQMAYQGFAKDNFTMLDNLKLGYGGTKAEMERLLEDAEAILAKQGVVRDFSIDSFADIVEAIHAVQVEYEVSGYSVDELSQKLQDKSLTEQELHRISQDLYASRSQQYQDEQDAYNQVVEAYQNGSLSIQDALILTGTTSYEAKETVEGSLNALQGAWDNFLVSLGDDDTDVGETTDKLVVAACNAIEKIVPRVGTILGKLAVVVAEKGPEALRRLKEAFLNSLPPEWREKIENFGKNVDEFIKKLGPLKDWLEENIPKAMKFLGDVFDSFTDEDGAGKKFLDFLDGLAKVITTVGDTFYKIGNNIGVCLADLVSGFEGTENVGGTVFYNVGEFFRKCGEVFADVKDTIDRVISDVTGFFEGLETGVDETISNVIDFFKNLPQNILDALGNVGDLLWGAGESIMNGFWDGLESVWNNLTGWIGDIGGWIADNKGPKEYDLKLLVPNGKWIMQGLEKGLRSNMGLIDDALDDITDRMSMDMTLSSTSSAGPVVGARSTGPQIIIQEMNVREEQDIYKVADRLDVIWNAEIAGSLV